MIYIWVLAVLMWFLMFAPPGFYFPPIGNRIRKLWILHQLKSIGERVCFKHNCLKGYVFTDHYGQTWPMRSCEQCDINERITKSLKREHELARINELTKQLELLDK